MTGPQTDASESEGQLVYMEMLSEVATRENQDVLELPPLGETVDVDALCHLVDSLDDGNVSFRYFGYDITVDADETIEIRRRDG